MTGITEMGTRVEDFDLTVPYDALVKPKLEEVQRICKDLGLPFIANFAIKSDEERLEISTSAVLNIDERHINEFAAVVGFMQGDFVVVPKDVYELFKLYTILHESRKQNDQEREN